jgi:hypothetical protein
LDLSRKKNNNLILISISPGTPNPLSRKAGLKRKKMDMPDEDEVMAESVNTMHDLQKKLKVKEEVQEQQGFRFNMQQVL